MAQAPGAPAARQLRPPTRSRSPARPVATADRRCLPAPAGPVSSVRLGTAGPPPPAPQTPRRESGGRARERDPIPRRGRCTIAVRPAGELTRGVPPSTSLPPSYDIG